MILSDNKSQDSFTGSRKEEWVSPLQQEPTNASSFGLMISATNPDLFDGQEQQRPMTRQLLLRFQRANNNPLPTEKDPLRSATPPLPVLILAALGVLSATYVVSSILSDLLAQWEWFQLWRYTWPFGIGALYLTGNVVPLSSTFFLDLQSSFGKTEPFLGYITLIGQSSLSRIILIVLSLGMMIGGAYDVWMPVYMTGPNVVTAAGIGQDAAVGLFLWTFWQTTTVLTTTETANSSSITKSLWFLLSSTLLLAELYKLGEGSWDELVFAKFLPL